MKTIFMILMMCAYPSLSYQISSGDNFLGGGLGASVNAVRYDIASRESFSAAMPWSINYLYALDPNVGVYVGLMPHFAPGSISIMGQGGVKYFLPIFGNSPYIPYVGLGLTTSVMVPTEHAPNHYNLGISSALGLNYFVLANFQVGFGFHLNPSIAFIDHENKLELAAVGFFDVVFRI